MARFALVVLCLSVGCSTPLPADSAESTEIAPGVGDFADYGPENLVLIHVDTLRADHTPWYGYERNTFPLSSARAWTRVDGYIATSSWTGSATASALTGAQLSGHGLYYSTMEDGERGGGTVNQPVVLPTLAEHLAARGYRTALFSGNDFVGPNSGMDKGFSHYVPVGDNPRSSNAEALAETALGWLDMQPPDEPFFLMLQPMDAHLPLSPPDEDYGTWSDPDQAFFSVDMDERSTEDTYRALVSDPRTAVAAHAAMVNLYDEQLLGVDRAVEAIISGLAARGRLGDTLIVLSGDHGESLGELRLDMFGHGKAFRPEVLRAPLLVLDPVGAGGELGCLSSGVDLAPTLTRALGVDVMETPDGFPIQDSCRTRAFAAYGVPQGLMYAAALDREEMVLRSCRDGLSEGLDLRADPFGGVSKDIAELGALEASLEDGVAALSKAGEWGSCGGL